MDAGRPPFAWRPVGLVALALVGVLLAVASRYGFHRDELYFIVAGRHLDWGYPDQPPLTPLLTQLQVTLFGLSPTAIRVLPALAAGGLVVLAAAIAREFGGGRTAQLLAAVAVATGGGFVAIGHLQSTATYDILLWTLVSYLVVRQMRGADPRWWLAVGVAAGIGLQNKHLIVLLAGAVVIGLLLVRRWDVLRSPWPWAGVGLALVIWAPNLAWQASHGWPQLEMAGRIASRDAVENRVLLLPMQLLVGGLFLAPILVAGVVWLLRSPAARPWRAFAAGYLVLLAVLFATGGKGYYAAGLLPLLFAAGAVPAAAWLARGGWRMPLLATGIVANAAFTALVSLPLLPPDVLAATPIPDIYPENAEQVGWEALVDEVDRIAGALPPEERAHAVVFTANYGEAGAVAVLTDGRQLPPAYSGHNGFAAWGPPPESATTVIVLGYGSPSLLAPLCGSVDEVAIFHNGYGLENQEEGRPIFICRDPQRPWADGWDELRHLD
jgi:4-amino-4-deoxy-L-arabinose transferase-like glycosyltransferase